jgi:hypothetical protein
MKLYIVLLVTQAIKSLTVFCGAQQFTAVFIKSLTRTILLKPSVVFCVVSDHYRNSLFQ